MAMQARSSELTQQARALWDRLRWGLDDLRRVLVARGLWLAPAITVTDANGRLWRVDGGRTRPQDSGVATGVLIETTACLWGTLSLPQMPLRATDGAVHEALWRVSPLPLEQVLCAWTLRPASAGLDGWHADWGLCPEPNVQAALQRAGLGADAPVFLARADGRVLAARGAARQQSMRRQRRSDVFALIVLALAVLSLGIPALMPLALKRQTVIHAMQHQAAVTQQAAPLRDKLDALRQNADTMAQLREEAAGSVPLASVVERLAAALPDDTWLNRLEVSNRQIRLTGFTGNATNLISRLSKEAEFADVHTTAPTVRDESEAKDRFSFEMRWHDNASAAGDSTEPGAADGGGS